MTTKKRRFLFVIDGKSGAGKTTLRNYLRVRYGIRPAMSLEDSRTNLSIDFSQYGSGWKTIYRTGRVVIAIVVVDPGRGTVSIEWVPPEHNAACAEIIEKDTPWPPLLIVTNRRQARPPFGAAMFRRIDGLMELIGFKPTPTKKRSVKK